MNTIFCNVTLQYAITFYEKNVEDLDGGSDSRALLGETVWLPDHEILLVRRYSFHELKKYGIFA